LSLTSFSNSTSPNGSCRDLINFEEDGLRHVLRFAEVAEDLERNAQDQKMITVEQQGKSIIVAGLDVRHDFLVREPAESRERQAARFRDGLCVAFHVRSGITPRATFWALKARLPL
jgi:hypothetical protein